MPRVNFFAFLFVFILFSSCEKDEPVLLSRADILTSQPWTVSELTANETSYDLLIEMQYAQIYQGTRFKFNNDGSFVWELTDGNSENGVWYFNQDYSVITIVLDNRPPEEFEIKTINSDYLEVIYFLPDNIGGYLELVLFP